MRQVWITRAGSPDVLAVRESNDPTPKAGEVRIRVASAGVNFADIMGRMGMYPDLPKIPCVPGYEVSGVVDATAPGLEEDWLGKPVFALTRFGGYSDVICVPHAQVFVRPPTMDALDGGAFAVAYFTAFQLMVVMGSLRAGDTMLIHSAGGAVGIAATQIARHLGATVIGTASENKHARLKDLGVTHCIDYRTEDYAERVMSLTAGARVELILNPLGGDTIQKDLRLLAPTGRLGLYGVSVLASGKTRNLFNYVTNGWKTMRFKVNPLSLMNRNKGVYGVNIGHLWGQEQRIRTWGYELIRWYQEESVKPVIAATFSFDKAAEAHHYIQDRKNFGKVLLVP